MSAVAHDEAQSLKERIFAARKVVGVKETQRTSVLTIFERIIEMQLISDLGPDRDLPVPNRRDARRGAVRVPDGAAAAAEIQ